MRSLGPNDLIFLINAAKWTIYLSLSALALGAAAGALICLARLSANPLVRSVAAALVAVGQGVPPLVQLFLAYFGLALAGFDISPFIASAVALSFFTAVYLGEIWRSAIESIPRAQWEAAESLALTWPQQMVEVIVPQAIRIATPPTVGFVVQLVKNTSLASIVGLVELTRAGQLVNNATFQSFQVFLAICVIYFVMCFPISALSRFLEARLKTAG